MISPKKIKTIGDRCLRQKSEEVEFDKDEMEKLHAEMCQAMWMADGIGLAAPQIGINKRVIIVDESTEEHGKIRSFDGKSQNNVEKRRKGVT